MNINVIANKYNMLDKLIILIKQLLKSYNKLFKETFLIMVIWIPVEIIVDSDPDLNLLLLSCVRVWAIYSLGGGCIRRI